MKESIRNQYIATICGILKVFKCEIVLKQWHFSKHSRLIRRGFWRLVIFSVSIFEKWRKSSFKWTIDRWRNFMDSFYTMYWSFDRDLSPHMDFKSNWKKKRFPDHSRSNDCCMHNDSMVYEFFPALYIKISWRTGWRWIFRSNPRLRNRNSKR